MGPVDHAAGLMENLKVQEEPSVDLAEPPSQDGNVSDSSGEASICSNEMVNGNAHEVTPESGVFYSTNGYEPGYAYEYGVEYEEYPRYVGVNGVDPNIYTDTSGSLVYHPGYGYAYAPYSPGTYHAIAADGQLYAQPYQFAVYGQYQVVEADYGDDKGARPVFPVAVMAPQSAYHPRGVMAVHSPSSGGSEGLRANAPPWIDMKTSNHRRPTVQANKSQAHSQTSQSLKSTTPELPGALGTAFPPLTRAALNGAATGKGVRTSNGSDTDSADGYKAKGKEAGPDPSGRVDVEQSRGPRTKVRFQRLTPGMFKQPAKGEDFESVDSVTRDQYNRADFSTSYEEAKFFVIKSYSEDDVHKSIKYSLWASTPNGNKRLDAAYQEAKASKKACPVFLFFSVNGSGQFCGVAEMTGPVDFFKSMDFWQQDKWSGCFTVKWHFVKDVSNQLFRHIILENNDNKPVTNSRDTQEVKLSQGCEMLNIFKNCAYHKSILDDFQYYEGRQKSMQEKRSRQHQRPLQQQQHQGNAVDVVKCASENNKMADEAPPPSEVLLPAPPEAEADKNRVETVPRKSYLSSLAGGKDVRSQQVEVDVKAA